MPFKQAIVCERQLRLLLDILMPGVLKIIPERCQPDIYAVFNKFLDPDKIRYYSLNETFKKLIADVASAILKSFDPYGLTTLQPGRGMRASSSAEDRTNSNGDARPIHPGETLILAELFVPATNILIVTKYILYFE